MAVELKGHLQQLKRERMADHPDPAVNMLLDRNERVMPYSQNTLQSLFENLKDVPLNLYPDLGYFYKKLSGWLGVNEDEIYVTEGVSGAIKSLLETIARPRGNVVFPSPTFALYPVYTKMFDLEERTAGYTKDYQLDTEGIKNLIDKETAVVFLPNPNVPIEGAVDLSQVVSLAKQCAKYGAFLAIDEVYFLFGGPTAINLMGEVKNLFVMRSFSKAFGLAGIRLGYVVSTEENIGYISKMRTGYETNAVSAAIASFFIDNHHLVDEYTRDVKEGLAYLKKGLTRLKLKYNGGTSSNFLYVDMEDEALLARTVDALKARGVYIRGGWPRPYASGFTITGGPTTLMERFIHNLSEVITRIV